MNIVIVLFVSIALLAMSSIADATPKKVSGTGPSRDDAIRNMCAKALEARVIELVGQDAAVQNRDGLIEAMLKNCDSFARGFEVADESTDGNSIEVKGTIDIDDAKVKSQLASLGISKGGGRTVVAFASEKIMGNWTGSYFGSTLGDEAPMNGCETALTEALQGKGFDIVEEGFNDSQRSAMRSFMPVFGRYKDLDMMPNDMVVKASNIVESDAFASVACRADAMAPDRKDSAHMYTTCADVSCKAVDTKTKRRVATATESKCFPHVNQLAGSKGAIAGVCREVGIKMGEKLRELYSKH